MIGFALVLVVAVACAAFGGVFDIPALIVLSAVILAGVIGVAGKVLVATAVYLNGTTQRLKSLNDRYDDTEVWLEQFDKGTRATFTKQSGLIREAEVHRQAISGFIEDQQKTIAAQSERLEAFSKSHATREALDSAVKSTENASAQLAKSLKESAGEIEKLTSEASALRKQIESAEALVKAQEREIELLREADDRLQESIQAAADNASAAQQSAEAGQAQLEEKIRELNESAQASLESTQATLKSAIGDHSNQTGEQLKDLVQRTESLAKGLKSSSSLAGRLRGEGYAQFGRLIGAEFINHVQGELGKRLDLDISNRELRYLERKVQHIEAVCEGRLATTSEDVVARVLAARSRRVAELNVLEIGVLFGVGAAFMHTALAPFYERVRLVLLDPFDGYYGSEHLDPLTGQRVSRRAVERNIRRAGILMDDITVLEGFSTDDAIQKAAGESGPYDVLVIDGDHTFDGVKADFERYAEMLVPGGMLIVDDYGSDDWPDVTKYVDSVVEKDDRFERVGTLSRTAIFRRQTVESSAKKSTKSRTVKSDAAKTEGIEAAEKPKIKAKARPAKTTSKKSASRKPSTSKATRKKASDDEPVVVETRTTKKARARKASSDVESKQGASAGRE